MILKTVNTWRWMKLPEQIYWKMFSKNDVPSAYNRRFKLGLSFLIIRASCILVWNFDLNLRNIEKLFKPNLTVEQESHDKIWIFLWHPLEYFEIQMRPDSCDQMSRWRTNVCHVHVTRSCEFIDDIWTQSLRSSRF